MRRLTVAFRASRCRCRAGRAPRAGGDDRRGGERVAFLALEWIVDHGTDWLWDDLLHTDERRWVVVIPAVGLGVAYSSVLRLLGQPRWVEPHTDPLAGTPATDSASPAQIAVLFVVGASSLLAGASLGPEAPLLAVSVAVGAWLAGTGRVATASPLLVLASVGALLVAFLGPSSAP